ncbi:hypothetical protein Q3V94_11865 [Caloramator sp. CAR-1]|uniref:hypothetical protein n=1 Tax=Caloramator sp. CAR-1 TaxID=3062777 RepID=UPI0026E450C8|nr:hypothetical protein [Caloramator sp. CAR-1]MDO6355751.1 hypothetical protein [Caloramator sp. CAR-1]
MGRKMPPIIKFFILLLVLNILILGFKLTLKNTTPEKCINNVIKDALAGNISHYQNKEKLVKIKDAFDEHKKQGLLYAFHNVSYDKDKKIYDVLIAFRNNTGDIAFEKRIEIAIKLKERILTYEFDDATIIYSK